VYDTPRTIEQILTMLSDAPAHIAGLVEGLSSAQLLTSPTSGEWPARDVLAHLRACSEVWGKYIRLILSQDDPTYKAVNPTTWIKHTGYLQQEFQPLLEAYTNQRSELLAVLKALPPEAWDRTATAITAGRPRQRTLYTYALWLANHERSHYRQINNIANAMATVGRLS